MDDELDRVFSPQDEIVPSSGFATSVMEAVRREAAAETTEFPPIAFPWVRALPVFVALAAVLGMMIAGFIELVRMPSTGVAKEWTLPPAVEHALLQDNIGWIAFALLLGLLSSLVSIRLAVGRR